MCILELGQKMILSHEYMIIQLLSLQRNKSFEMFISRYLRFKCKVSSTENLDGMFAAFEMIEEKTLLQSDRSIRITLLVDCIFVFAHHD